MGAIRSFRDLEVWQRAVELAVASYAITRVLPKEERFALGDQMRRSAVSISTNIAEGHARHSTAEFLQALSHSRGSLGELETLLEIAVRVSYVSDADASQAFSLATDTGRLLSGLVRSLREKLDRPSPRPRRPRHPPGPQPPASGP